MKSTNPLRYVLVLVPMLAALVVMPAAFADATSNAVVLDEPFAVSDDNPCTGEPVVFTGSVHHVMHVSMSASGGFHLDDNMDIQASGISATLVSYTMSDRQFLSINLSGTQQTAETTVNFATRITRAGESWPLPDGVPTAETTKGPGSECR